MEQTNTPDRAALNFDLHERRQAEFAKAHNHEAIDKYWDKVRSHEHSIESLLTSKPFTPKVRSQVLDYETAREYVIRIICESFTSKKFVSDDKTKLLLTNLTKYFINDPSGAFDINKGILLYGGTGTGKTSVMRIFMRLADALDIKDGYDKKFSIIKTSDVVLDIRVKENEGFIRQYFSNSFCFDDMGQEPTDTKIYGNTVSVMGDIIFNRYDRSNITHVTTNLNENEIKAKYGQRIHSRMAEMFNWVLVDGKDHRI